MADVGHGLQIVSVTSSHSYELEEAELEQLLLREDVRDLPVVVVSVAGAYRGGKSFLLNFFIRYLSAPPSARTDGSWLGENSAPLAGFQWRSGIKATTMGVLMWSEPFITTLPSGEKVAVLLVDTQGNFDSTSTVRDNSTIFALSTLISSVQIYNLSQNIKEDDLQHLELFTEYGKLMNAEDSNAKPFQVLEFLVRDWQFPDDFPYGAVGGQSVLEEKLEITPYLTKEMKELRNHIRSSFEKVSCFLMPHPGFEVLEPSYNGNISDISTDFRLHLKDLVNSLFGPTKLLPKTINGERVKARELFNYFKTYMDLFNSDKIPNPTNLRTATVRAGLLSAKSIARDIYENGMDSECGPKQLGVSNADLKFLHEKYVQQARAAYTNKKKMGSPKEIDEYLVELTKELNERLPHFAQSNLSKIQSAITKAKEAYSEAIQSITKDRSLCVHPKDLENIHNTAVDAALTVYDAAKKNVTGNLDNEREEFKQSFKKNYLLNQQVNKQNNLMAVAELKYAYWAKMQAKTGVDPPLSKSEFEEAHVEAQANILNTFDSKRNISNYYSTDEYKDQLTEEIQKLWVLLKKINESDNKTAFIAASNEYNRIMKELGEENDFCVHPNDLEEQHREAMCHALIVFRPNKQCSDGFDKINDDDESTLYKVLTDHYQDFKSINDNTNKTAVLTAFNVYHDEMDRVRRKVITWAITTTLMAVLGLGTLTTAFTTAGLKLFEINNKNENAKAMAYDEFYAHRKGSQNQYTRDPYKDLLTKKMMEYYQTYIGL